jgi:heterotetrameric sarcosine oxidase delta subunit
MQTFPCPFCGPRDEREFHFAAEAGKTRPMTDGKVSAEDWAHYLYAQRNPKGISREIWMHVTCRELFVMKRDTVSMEVLGVEPLRSNTE